MSRRIAFLVSIATVAVLVVVGCGQPAPAPTPTKAAAAPAATAAPAAATAPAKAAEPTKPAAAPTAAAAPKVNFPEKGKPITIIVPWDAGGAADVGTRLTAPLLEKELGVPVQVVNKPGAGSQLGLAEFAKAKPDGYTIGGTNLPNSFLTYMDPDRKATYGRKDFTLVANHIWDPEAITVRVDSPIKSLKDLIEAAKAKPRQVKLSTIGVLTNSHIDIMALQRTAGVEFASVHFTGGATAVTALLGEHVDACVMPVGNTGAEVKGGKIRILAVYDKQRSKLYPDVKTMKEEIGLDLVGGSSRGYSVPAGTSPEIVKILAGAFQKAAADSDLTKKLADMGLEVRYLDAAGFSAFWDEWEASAKPLMDMAKKDAETK